MKSRQQMATHFSAQSMNCSGEQSRDELGLDTCCLLSCTP